MNEYERALAALAKAREDRALAVRRLEVSRGVSLRWAGVVAAWVPVPVEEAQDKG